MPNFTQGSTRVALQQPDLTSFQNNGIDGAGQPPHAAALVRRPLSGRQRPGAGTGLLPAAAGGSGAGRRLRRHARPLVSQPPTTGPVSQRATRSSFNAGDGITPAGELVMIPTDLTIRSPTWRKKRIWACSSASPPCRSSRRARAPVCTSSRCGRWSSRPIPSLRIPPAFRARAPRTMAISSRPPRFRWCLIQIPSTTPTPSQQRAMLARQIFVTGNAGTLAGFAAAAGRGQPAARRNPVDRSLPGASRYRARSIAACASA